MKSSRKSLVLLFVALFLVSISFVIAESAESSVSDSLLDSGSYVLQGKIVTMESEEAVIPSGNILIKNGLVEAIWSTDEAPPTGVDISGSCVRRCQRQ